jgi:hypothetical protein
MTEAYVFPSNEKTLEATTFFTMSGEDLLKYNRDINFLLKDFTLESAQRERIERNQKLLVFEVNCRLNEGTMKRVLGEIAVS